MVGKHAKPKHRKKDSVVHPPAIPAPRKPGAESGKHIRKKDMVKPEEKKP